MSELPVQVQMTIIRKTEFSLESYLALPNSIFSYLEFIHFWLLGAFSAAQAFLSCSEGAALS